MIHFFTPEEIQNLCRQYGLRPSKDYGQNYLLHPEPIEEMLAAAELKKTDTVVEVGPGFGILTFALADEVKKVIAFEIEKKIKSYWDEKKEEYPNVEIHWQNALNKNIEYLISNIQYKVVANIPYQITSPLIKLFLEDVPNPPELIVLMVQKEVAERICSKPGDMSVLSIAVQYYADAEIVSNVPRLYFWPQPQVDSAIIKIRHKKSVEKGAKEFFHLVKAGFASRRKILIKNLLSHVGKENVSKLEKVWQEFGWSRTIRAQELSVDDWKKLAQRLV